MIVHGTLIHAPVAGELEIIDDALVTVDEDGTISSVESAVSNARVDIARAQGALIELGKEQYLLPGLVDLHVHAPQWPQLGKALDLPLNEWLQQCTFPLEAKYLDLAFARQSYESLVANLLANGTTTAAYFGTIHVEATKLLADIAHASGQRAVIGKVAMDNEDQCPDFYRDPTTRAGLDGTRELIEYVRGIEGNLLHPAVTPRFIPACTDDMLKGLAAIAEEYGCHVQTHCSEGDWEHRYVIDRCGAPDTQSLDAFGLLTDKTILAHAIFVDDDDISTIIRRGSGIAHCPLSNIYLSHAVFPARKVLDRGVKAGLGTDIAGGASPSILHNCQMAVAASRALEDGVDPALPAAERGTPGSRIDFREAFWMATAGGASALGLKIGRFAEGYAFDAIVVDTGVDDTDLSVWDGLDSADDILQKIVYNAGRQNIRAVWVQGRRVSG
jgi:guanine deaminase